MKTIRLDHVVDDLPNNILYVLCTQPITPAQLQAGGQEVQQTPKGPAHTDCYFDNFGEQVDQHPIASGGIRRG